MSRISDRATKAAALSRHYAEVRKRLAKALEELYTYYMFECDGSELLDDELRGKIETLVDAYDGLLD